MLASPLASSEPFASTYRPGTATTTLIRGATVLTGTGERVEGGDVLLSQGRIQTLGRGLDAPVDARVIDAGGRWVTPGLIDIHSHLGLAASPHVRAHNDFNEATSPVTAQVWAEHSVWPQDPGFETALAGGVTTLHVLPGSANLIGGRTVVLRNVRALSYQEMKFPGAPQGVKMACGENPKSVYGKKGSAPTTRMAEIAAVRQAFADAQEYGRQWEKYREDLAKFESKRRGHGSEEAGNDRRKRRKQISTDDMEKGEHEAQDQEAPSPPKRDLSKDTLLDVLEGRLPVHVHCYRADEMQTMLDVAAEFGFRIAAFHHGIEAYKIAARLAENRVCGALWADWWGFKMEALDGIPENIALVDRPEHGCAIVHSDSEEGVQRLNQEAAKAMTRGRRLGLDLPPERAIRWLTSNPAAALGIADSTGTLEPGKRADIVIWNREPFSVYALVDEVFIDGVLVFDRARPKPPRSDFQLGWAAEDTLP